MSKSDDGKGFRLRKSLDPTPKFVRERLSTSVNENGEVLSALSTSENGDKGK